MEKKIELSEQAKEARRAAKREWYRTKNGREKQREYTRRYWERKAANKTGETEQESPCIPDAEKTDENGE